MKNNDNRSKKDIEYELEHNIKALSDPKVHKDRELKSIIESNIKRLTDELKNLLAKES